jgi:hypothetical protein
VWPIFLRNENWLLSWGQLQFEERKCFAETGSSWRDDAVKPELMGHTSDSLTGPVLIRWAH